MHHQPFCFIISKHSKRADTMGCFDGHDCTVINLTSELGSGYSSESGSMLMLHVWIYMSPNLILISDPGGSIYSSKIKTQRMECATAHCQGLHYKITISMYALMLSAPAILYYNITTPLSTYVSCLFSLSVHGSTSYRQSSPTNLDFLLCSYSYQT